MELKDYMPSENTAFLTDHGTWKECIGAAGALLEANGYIVASYTDAMVSMVETMGPYIVIMPGIALAHARPAGNVKKNGISLVTLKNGVNFGSEDNDPVYAVFAIAARSDAEHLVLFKALGRFLADEEKAEAVKSVKAYEDIVF